MRKLLATALDRWVIQLAAANLRQHQACPGRFETPQPPFQFSGFDRQARVSSIQTEFISQTEFRFLSPVQTAWPKNNLVWGRLNRVGKHWRERPAVLLLHGWNAELSYHYQFPYLAWRLNRRGLNAVMIQLPFHGKRRPGRESARRDFITGDLMDMFNATTQAVADIAVLLAWLRQQGCPAVGLWGFSLGAWLAGLTLCTESAPDFAALLTPVVRMDRVVRDLPFCDSVRRNLDRAGIDLEPLNLRSLQPITSRSNILLIASEHDLFAPKETIEECWHSWRHPEIWWLPHGHISVLFSLPLMERTTRWLARQAPA